MVEGRSRCEIGRRHRGLAVLLIAGALLVPTVAAHASELEYMSKVKTVPSTLPTLNGRGLAEAACPGSHPQVTGGGVKITGDNNGFDLQVGSTLPQESAQPTRWLGEANNSSGSDAQMTTTAICSKGRFKYPIHSRPIGPGGQATKRVSCPSGTKLTGGGVATSGDSPEVQVAVSMPFDGPDGNSTPDGWLGSANNGTDSPETVTVNAVCAESGQYKYVQSALVPLPDNTSAAAVATCPPGTVVSGGGVENSGIGLGAEIESTFPLPDTDWVGRANNDNTGQAETVQTFAICKATETRRFSGDANGGTVTFKTRFEDGKTVKVLPGLTFGDVPIHCSNGDTTHTVTVDPARKVTHNAFSAHDDSEIGQPHAAFALAGQLSHGGTEASGTYREHGNLKSANGTFVFTNCDTGTIHWSAHVVP